MSKFSMNSSQPEAGVLRIEITGQLDEDAIFEEQSLGAADKIVIDLEKVKSINSCGIREWIKWIRSAKTDVPIELFNCPKVVVDQINMVAGFLPDNGVVRSFYVPFFCEDSGTEKMVLFEKDKQFDDTGLKSIEVVKDDEGNEMEMDVIEAKYFKFLKR